MTVLSSHTSRPLPDSTNYDQTMAWWDACIDAHIAAGAKYIVQPSMGRSAYESIENLKKWCDYFNKYPGRFELCHIKDKEETGASGMMDFASIWAARDISGMKYGIVEVEQYNFDQFTSCKVSNDFPNAAGYVVMPEQ